MSALTLKHGSVSAFGVPDNMARSALTKLSENITGLVKQLQAVIDEQAATIKTLQADLAKKALATDLTTLSGNFTTLSDKVNNTSTGLDVKTQLSGKSFVGGDNGSTITVLDATVSNGGVAQWVRFKKYLVKNGVLVAQTGESSWTRLLFTDATLSPTNEVPKAAADFGSEMSAPTNSNGVL